MMNGEGHIQDLARSLSIPFTHTIRREASPLHGILLHGKSGDSLFPAPPSSRLPLEILELDRLSPRPTHQAFHVLSGPTQ
jgi:hypothetical protein